MKSRVGLAEDSADRIAEAAIQFKRGDPERKRKVLELFSTGLGATVIAKVVGGTEASVRKIRDSEKQKQVAAQAGPGNPWYEITDIELVECMAAARNELPTLNTDLDELVTVHKTKGVEAAHISTHYFRARYTSRSRPETESWQNVVAREINGSCTTQTPGIRYIPSTRRR